MRKQDKIFLDKDYLSMVENYLTIIKLDFIMYKIIL